LVTLFFVNKFNNLNNIGNPQLCGAPLKNCTAEEEEKS